MPRKVDFPKDQKTGPRLMPFQMKYKNFPKEGFDPVGTFGCDLQAAMSTFPIFGGAEDDDESPSEKSNKEPASSSSDTPTSGGDSPKLKEAEVPNLEAMTPEKIAELLKNVTELSQQVTKLTAENNTYKSKEQQVERAKQTREQQLENDLVESQKIIAQMDSVIRHSAIINAIQGAKDIEFHSARHVMNELVTDAFDLDVDLESGTATVTGIEAELKRIAKEMPWLVSKDKSAGPATQQDNTRQRQVRGSGAPPSGGADGNKQVKRSDLINRFPVIAHGRAG